MAKNWRCWRRMAWLGAWVLLAAWVLCPSAASEAGERGAALAYLTETEAGREMFAAFVRRELGVVPAATGEQTRAEGVLRELVTAAGEDASAVQAIVVPNQKFNAYALPGGIIIVNQAVFAVLPDDELAVILAHELAHHVLGHPVAAMERAPLSRRILGRIKVAEDGTCGMEAALRLWRAVQASEVLKREERAADEWAADLMLRSGYPLAAACNLWDRLQQLYGRAPNGGVHLSYRERKVIFAKVYGAGAAAAH